jgi:hypothetical protein
MAEPGTGTRGHPAEALDGYPSDVQRSVRRRATTATPRREGDLAPEWYSEVVQRADGSVGACLLDTRKSLLISTFY